MDEAPRLMPPALRLRSGGPPGHLLWLKNEWLLPPLGWATISVPAKMEESESFIRHRSPTVLIANRNRFRPASATSLSAISDTITSTCMIGSGSKGNRSFQHCRRWNSPRSQEALNGDGHNGRHNSHELQSCMKRRCLELCCGCQAKHDAFDMAAKLTLTEVVSEAFKLPW